MLIQEPESEMVGSVLLFDSDSAPTIEKLSDFQRVVATSVPANDLILDSAGIKNSDRNFNQKTLNVEAVRDFIVAQKKGLQAVAGNVTHPDRSAHENTLKYLDEILVYITTRSRPNEPLP